MVTLRNSSEEVVELVERMVEFYFGRKPEEDKVNDFIWFEMQDILSSAGYKYDYETDSYIERSK